MKHKRKQFDEFSRHEVYDRASIVLELFCTSVAEHQVVAQDKALCAEAEKVSDAIYRFYNLAADKLMPSAATKMAKRNKRAGVSRPAGMRRKLPGRKVSG
jgi:hypothetical protein